MNFNYIYLYFIFNQIMIILSLKNFNLSKIKKNIYKNTTYQILKCETNRIGDFYRYYAIKHQ